MRVFILIDHYIPSFKSGGPVRTIANMVSQLNGNIQFHIFCRDRDFSDKKPYSGVLFNAWVPLPLCNVYYSNKNLANFLPIIREIKKLQPDVVYINSFFSPFGARYLLLRKLGLVPALPVVLAPRGEFSSGALKQKSLKKTIYIALAYSLFRLYDNITWQASTKYERDDIYRKLGPITNCHIASDLPKMKSPSNGCNPALPFKVEGHIKCVFLSRITPMKNLIFLFPILSKIQGQVVFDIYGPTDEKSPECLQQCMIASSKCPSNIQIRFLGPIQNEQVIETLSLYHIFLLPTLGENFGHVILEGLIAGNIMIISDQTQWQDLQTSGAGFVLPLESVRWVQTIQSCVDMNNIEYMRCSKAAVAYGNNFVSTPALADNIELFQKAISNNIA